MKVYQHQLGVHNILMQLLRQYKRLLKISCISACEGKTENYTFEVRFQQAKPHSLFKYEVAKHKEQVKQLYNKLEDQIFDFENPFNQNMIASITKPHHSARQEINVSLQECMDRIDVITNRHFFNFFSIHLHYQDFVSCLKQEKEEKKVEKPQLEKPKAESQEKHNFEQYKHMFSTDKPWNKEELHHDPPKEKMKKEQGNNKTNKNKSSEFNQMTNLCFCSLNCQLELMKETEVLDFTHVRYYENQLLYVLQHPKKTTMVKNFFKSVFNKGSATFGYLSIHRKQKGAYVKITSTQLLADVVSMDYNSKTNMILITTSVGVYIYLAKMEAKLEEIEIFSYVELVGCVDCASNSIKAELYILGKAEVGRLHVYSINQEKLMKTQYKYQHPSAVCYEQQNNRLFVSDQKGIHIYEVMQSLQVKYLHKVEIDSLFKRLSINHGYLLGISEKGFMTVIQLKPPQKEQLISVTTTINLPQNSIKIVGSSKNKRLLITHYKRCLTLIDTIEGPIFSLKLDVGQPIRSIFSDKEQNLIQVLTEGGHLSFVKLNELII